MRKQVAEGNSLYINWSFEYELSSKSNENDTDTR